MKFCKFCNRHRNEEFNYCPRCGAKLVDRVSLIFPVNEKLKDEQLLREKTDLNAEQIANLCGHLSAKQIEITFTGNRVDKIEFVTIA